jgi:hypothetical protein
VSLPNVLTDNGGVAAITGSKILKDFVADALMGAAAALVAVQVSSVDQAIAQPMVVVTAIAGAVISAAYRIVLRWATSS